MRWPTDMRIPRVYTNQPLASNRPVVLEQAASHHVSRVLRMQPGARLVLFNGDGLEFAARLTGDDEGRVVAETFEVADPQRESPLNIHLGQAVSRGERMDYTLQKSVELGVQRITPLWTRRTQVKLDGKRLEKRMQHWRGVIVAACEQSGRTRIPVLATPRTLTDWCRQKDQQQMGLVLDPGAKRSLGSLGDGGTEILLLSGPEGGLDQEEIDAAQATGFTGVRLGPRILRTETAAVAALSALQTLWGDF